MKTQMPSSLEIAQGATLRPILDVAAEVGLVPEEVEPYGRYKAKVDLSVLERLSDRPDAKLINVTAITPTPAGEGKTTTSVSLTQGLGVLGKKPVLCLREASLGPVFGVKGGAAGGGYAQVVPMEDLNLHFTGDLHAITAANNLLSALIDAHLMHGNVLGLDPITISWRRCLDMNDRSLRDVVTGLGGKANGYPRQTGFDITAASEIMAMVAVARDLARPPRAAREDHRRPDVRGRAGDRGAASRGRLARGRAQGSDQAEPRPDARRPARLRPLRTRSRTSRTATTRSSPTGSRSSSATTSSPSRGSPRTWGWRSSSTSPAASATCDPTRSCSWRPCGRSSITRATPTAALDAIEVGAQNLARHIGIVNGFGLQAVVGVNRFPTDTDDELEVVRKLALEHGAYAAEVNEAFERGGEGATALAEAAIDAAEQPSKFEFAYPIDAPIEEKIRLIATRVYGADGVELLPAAKQKAAGVRAERSRRAADLHGEDAPLALARPGAPERADRLHGAGSRPQAVHGRGLARRPLRRHDDHARPREDAGRVRDRHRRERARRSGCSSASG